MMTPDIHVRGLLPKAMNRITLAALTILLLFVAACARASMPCVTGWYDQFAYGQPTRPLNGNGGWTGGATDQILAWDNWCCVIVGGSGGFDANTTGLNYYGAGGIIWVHTAIVGYNDTSIETWNILLDDELGRNHARLCGSGNWVLGRSGSNSTTSKSLTDRAGHDIDIKINTSNDTAEFFADGVSLGQLTYPNGQSAKVDRVRLERVDSGSAAGMMLLIGEFYVGEADLTPPPVPQAPFRPLTWHPNTSVTFTWPQTTDNCTGVASYNVQVGTSPGAADVADTWIGNTTSYSFTGVSGVTYYCRVRARDNRGNESVWSEVGSSVVEQPAPAMPVDGRPFFPIGYYTSACHSSAAEARDYLAVQSAQGMNTALACYSVWGCGDLSMTTTVEGAALAGLKVAMEVNRYAVDGNPGYPPSVIDAQVDLLKNYPNMIGWYLSDEPETRGIPPSLLQSRYAQIKARDPEHSIWVVHYAYPPLGPPRPALNYLPSEPPPYCDGLMTDTYPVNYGSAEFAGPLWWVALESKAHTDMAISYGKEVYLNVPQVQGYQDFNTRLPTYPEQRYLSYAPVVYGSRGLLFWMYEAYTAPEHEENVVGPIAREISRLIPAIMSDSTTLRVTSDHDTDSTGHGFPDVGYMFGEDDSGAYLIAINNTANSFPVTFTLSSLAFADFFNCATTSIPVEFESRTAPIQVLDFPNLWTMTDSFTPYDVNVYRLWDGSSEVSIDLGSPDMANGLTNPQPPEGDTTPINHWGRNCRRNVDPSGSPADAAFYFAVSDAFAFQGSKTDLYINIDYYDTGSGALELLYDAAGSAQQSGGSVPLTGSNTWKQHCWRVTDAYFGNRQSGGADFSIVGPAGAVFYIDQVRVSVNQPGSPAAVASCDPREGSAPLTVKFTGSKSRDADGSIVLYEWDFDGNGITDAVGPTAQHTYSTNGTVVASLRVTDNLGLTDVKTMRISVGPGGPTPPTAVSGFTASVNNGAATLNWTNPADCDLEGIVIRAKIGGYPTSTSDGRLICDKTATPGAADSYSYGIFDNAQWYFAAYAYDGLSSYSAPAYATAVSCVAIWLNDEFEPYSLGNLGGQGGWTTTGPASAQVVTGLPQSRPGQAALMDTIASGDLAIGNELTLPPRQQGYYFLNLDVAENSGGTAGTNIGWVTVYASDSSTEITKLYVQKSRLLLEYGTGSLAILSTSIANNTWYTVKIGIDVDLRKLDVWLNGSSKGTGYAWKGTGANIARIAIGSARASATPQQVFIDNLSLQPKPPTPTAVRDDGEYTPSLSKLHFSFDPIVCQGSYQYAIGTVANATNIRGWTGIGLSTDFTATGLTLNEGSRYYIGVQASNGYTALGDKKWSDGIRVAAGVSIPAAKALANGEARSLRNKTVSAVFPGYFYLYEPAPPHGIRVLSSASALPGDSVEVAGLLQGSGAERYLDATNCGIFVTRPGPGAPDPMSFAAGNLGGTQFNALTPGVLGALGPNNIGLLVRVYGVITQRDPSNQYFYIDEGSGLRDGTTTGVTDNIGVRISGDPSSYPEGSYIAVTGISSLFDAGGLRPRILPTGVEILRP